MPRYQVVRLEYPNRFSAKAATDFQEMPLLELIR